MTVTAPPARPAPASPTGSPRRRIASRRRRDFVAALAFLTPFLVVYGLFVVLPVVQAGTMSLYDWDLLGFTRDFIGLENYRRMLWGTGMTWGFAHLAVLRAVLLAVVAVIVVRRVQRRASLTGTVGLALAGLAGAAVLGVHPGPGGSWNDATFWLSLEHTVQFTALSTPLLVGFGLVLALAMHGLRRGVGFYRTAFFLPYILPVSAVTLIWSFLLNPARGLLASVFEWFGAEPIDWLSDPGLAMWGIILTTIWWSVGLNFVLFLAGLQDIDPLLYEAASLDGANAWQRFVHVTVPGLRQVTVLVAVTQLIASFQIFGQVYIMTRGGPGTSTRVLIQHIYEAGFRDLQLGYAAAVSLFLFAVMAAVSAIQFRVLSRES